MPNPAPGRTTRPEEDEIEAENGAESRRPFVLEGAFFMKRDIRERLKAEVLLTDGAMGTLLVAATWLRLFPALATRDRLTSPS